MNLRRSGASAVAVLLMAACQAVSGLTGLDANESPFTTELFGIETAQKVRSTAFAAYEWELQKTMQVTYVDSDAQIIDLTRMAPGEDWITTNLSSVAVDGPVYAPRENARMIGFSWVAGTRQVAFIDLKGLLREIWGDERGYWELNDLSDLTKAPLPAAGSDLSGTQLKTPVSSKQLMYLDDSGHVIEAYIVESQGWKSGDLTARIAAPDAEQGSAMSAYQWEEPLSKAVVYLDAQGHVHQLKTVHHMLGWTHFDPTQDTHAPVAASDSSLSGYASSSEHRELIVYLDEGGHIHELSGDLDGKWSYSGDLTEAAHAPAALRSSPLRGYDWPAAGSKQVAYFDEDHQLQQLYQVHGKGWQRLTLTGDAKPPRAASDSDLSAFAWTAGKSAHLVYVDEDNALREVRITENK